MISSLFTCFPVPLIGRCAFLAALALLPASTSARPPFVEGSLPLALAEARAKDGRTPDQPPMLTKRAAGGYPEHLLNHNLRLLGIVDATIDLDTQGEVTAIHVQFASHPAFVASALTRITESKFSPARIAGVPVASTAPFNSVFTAAGPGGLGVGGDIIRMPAKLPNLPPEYDYETAPLIRSFCEPVYPRELLDKKVQGKAMVRFIVDESGRVASSDLLSATQPEFGAALLAAVDTWTFEPATRQGKPCKAIIEQYHDFLPAGYRRPVVENEALKQYRRGGKAFVVPGDLDAPMKLVYQVMPQYPRALLKERPRGQATIEFVIAEDGQVTLPAIVSATQPEFGYAAMTAIQQWIFRRPISKGKAASVSAKLTLEFAP